MCTKGHHHGGTVVAASAHGNLLESLWDQNLAASMSESEQLLYRSNLLGSDLRITNFGGGNTSAKVMETDPLTGDPVEVLWVKGSGGDLRTISMDGFATLYMERLNALKDIYQGTDHEDAMVGYLPHCTFDLNARAASIDTPLHAFVPHKHVDHMHPDAVIAIAASQDSEKLTREIFGDEIGWLPWRRPGFELGLWIGRFAEENPQAKGVVLAGHGLFTWGATSRESYEVTLETINRAMAWFADKTTDQVAFDGAHHIALPDADRRAVAAQLMPAIRGRIGKDESKIGHFEDSPAVLDFVNSNALTALAPLGTSCPDHFLRTKIRPLIVPFEPTAPDIESAISQLADTIAAYRADYAAYYERCRHDDSPAIRDPNPVVYLIPGVGMITFGKDKPTARIAAEFYVNAINVMRGASSVSAYQGLSEQEAFNIEYWLLEEAKLQRQPKAKQLAGRIAFVTGGAGGIGRATAEQLIREGACVVISDIDPAGLETAVRDLGEQFSKDTVRGVVCDVTDESSVAAAISHTAVEYGGLDFAISNAGIVTGGAIDEITLEEWQLNVDVLSTGYFLVSRATIRLLKRQSLGGAIVFVASKNGLAASVNAAAYCAAKASEIHLARCLALECAPHGIRVNVVNPDGVLRGSKMWSDERRQERAQSYSVKPEDLDDFYRQRTLLKQSVYPEDIATGILFFVTDGSKKSTGNILNIDGGNVQSFTR
ncbi:MAG: bifunctional rhamnulose-1-phosphate aldolase/short-chain dehydrogenase [Hyphomicrobiales bacterium]|nr:bifunctional rhamnulose-1-phosphate aldolase/short-chain dehydrogenase [Hyphomicrobiales bacterium]